MSVNTTKHALTGRLQGVLLMPDVASGLGIIVLGGSSGRIDVDRAGLFASRGAIAIALQWFAGAGQAAGVCEIPIEGFTAAVDHLLELGCRQIAIIGTSKGAEGALLAAVHDPRIDVVIAISPSHVAWANSGVGKDGLGWPLRSSWTVAGEAVPFVRYDVTQMPPTGEGPIPYLAYHQASLAAFASDVPGASIPIERARAHMILVGGGDDKLWPSELSARLLAQRLQEAGKSHDLILDDEAGHRVLLPGETTPRSTINLHGGSDEADARLGAKAWTAMCRVLALIDE